ncbi:MAG: galactokinase [Clostridiales bacterium]|jgi:galactokinase|nr:galactokinase [Clostridiales bacterium]
MMGYDLALKQLEQADTRKVFEQVYADPGSQLERVAGLIKRHQAMYQSTQAPLVLSAPGRAEIIGNHTDHNNGLVLAAAVNLDTVAVVTPREDLVVNLSSEGYDKLSLSLDSLMPDKALAGTSASLIKGVAADMKERGYKIGGFDAVMNSQVLSGSGLSSSAAFEVLVCFIFDALYNGTAIDATTRAQISQYAENAFFMKPSGLMDQMASSHGGMVKIDFGPKTPVVENLHVSFAKAGYDMVIVNTRSSHDDLTEAYSAIPHEMKAAARLAGGVLLRDVPYDQFLKAIPGIRQAAGDRAVLRAFHFYQENQRVKEAAKALEENDLKRFFDAINDSGLSSETQLQNIHINVNHQPMSLALALAKDVLKGWGACRVHGGGFAGTTLNFVPHERLQAFTGAMEAVFGEGCCHQLDVRNLGPVRLV